MIVYIKNEGQSQHRARHIEELTDFGTATNKMMSNSGRDKRGKENNKTGAQERARREEGTLGAQRR